MAAAHDPYAALRSPDYRRLLTGNVLSALGTSMQSLVIGRRAMRCTTVVTPFTWGV